MADARPEKIMRGTKIRLYPNKHQTALLDLWRRRCMSLWNILLSLEQAAYSGEHARPEIRWRSIWAHVLEESYETNHAAWENGKTVRMGKNKGQVKPPKDGPEPQRPDADMMAKIRREAVDIDPDTGELLPAKLFMWEHELQKIMARLKQVPQTRWIEDLPSHAAQAVVKDLIKALQAMLRERKKRASGAGGRDTGFPKFKKNRYAAGSVYFANTQLKFDFKTNRIKFPNGVGWISLDNSNLAPEFGRAKLMGGRAWREGETWFLSCQWELDRPEPLPKTGRIAGVKLAAAVLLTTFDDRGQTREYTMPPTPLTHVAQYRRAGKRLAHVLAGQKRKKEKLAVRKAWQREKAIAAGKAVKPAKPARVRRSDGFYTTCARLADLEATERNRRDDFLHKLTTDITNRFDAIAVQKMEVAELMKKPSARARRKEERKLKKDDAANGRRDLKPVRKLMRHAAPARCRLMLEYKFRDLRGPQAYQEIGPFDVNVSACSSCGTIHPDWRDGRRIVRCEAELEDGSICGNVLPRNRNAARLTRRELEGRMVHEGSS